MKTTLASCLLGLTALTSIGIAQADGSSSDTEKAIVALEEKWTQSEQTNKADEIAPLLADKFMVTESEGQVLDKTAFLAEEKASHYSSSEMHDLKVIVFGDTAVARYVLQQKYTSKGKAVDVDSQETDTWVKMPGGAWQCVASHGSKIKKKS